MEFKGQYYFLSNSYNSPVSIEINGENMVFNNAEAAFLATKIPSFANELQNMNAYAAKQLAKTAKPSQIRKDWNEVREFELGRVLRAKFNNPYLKTKLLSVTENITFDVNYPDRYWGVYLGKGQNKLGKALTKIRDELKRQAGINTAEKKSSLHYKIQKGGVVCFDTETTGLSGKYDDILQITIVGYDGNVLLSTYVRPENCKEWPEAEQVHHISPNDVFKDNIPTVKEVAKATKYIFDNADIITGYNIGFDTKMVSARFGYDFKDKCLQDVFDLYKALVNVRIEDKERELLPSYLEKTGGNPNVKKDIKKATDLMLEENDEYFDLVERKHSRKLVDAVKYECPEVYRDFIANAHDACADTKATLELAKTLVSMDSDLLNRCINYIKDGEIEKISKIVKKTEEYNKDPHHRKKKILTDEIKKELSESSLLVKWATIFDSSTSFDEINKAGLSFMKEDFEHLKDELMLKKNSRLELNTDIDSSSLFGIKKGVICLTMNVYNIISEGFVQRIAKKYPAFEEEIKKKRVQFSKEKFELNKDPESNIGSHFAVKLTDDITAEVIYSQTDPKNAEKTKELQTNVPALLKAICDICIKYDSNVYLPIVTKWEEGTPVVTDGIGCGKAGGEWKNIGSKIKEMVDCTGIHNLYYKDTQNMSEIFAGNETLDYQQVKNKKTPTEIEEDDIEIG